MNGCEIEMMIQFLCILPISVQFSTLHSFYSFSLAVSFVAPFVCILICTYLQERGSNEIVFKAMGRAINKTVTIVELIKVIFIFYLFAYQLLACEFRRVCEELFGAENLNFVLYCREELLAFIRIQLLDPRT